MINEAYKIRCITRLHVGSGDVNFNIIDNEVEKDSAKFPVIHASGLKGALSSAYTGSEQDKNYIFGAPGDNRRDSSAGNVVFFDAIMLCRTMRVRGTVPALPVTSVWEINRVANLAREFGIHLPLLPFEQEPEFGNSKFLCTAPNVSVDGDRTGLLPVAPGSAAEKLKQFFGGDFALAKSFDNYPLPVIARNNLSGKGNLWYEEYVPEGSMFFAIIRKPDDCGYSLPSIMQIGGNASIGCGYCKAERI